MKGKTLASQKVEIKKGVKGLRTPPMHMGQLPGTTTTGKIAGLTTKSLKFPKPRKKPKSLLSQLAKIF